MRKLKEPEMTVDEYLLSHKDIASEKEFSRKLLHMPGSHHKEEKQNFYDAIKTQLYRAGLDISPSHFIKTTLHLALILVCIGFFSIGAWSVWSQFPWVVMVVYLLLWLVVGFIFCYSLVIVSSRIYLDYRTFKRRIEVEKVLPEFLRLVATNYRSGLSLDQALVKSNRSRFGVLSKEIKIISKTTKVKGDLAKALEIFGKKYESKILERAMNNVAMSVRTGSNVSNLLEEIANNITKMRNMRQSMAANIKNYIIFIVIAAVLIAPLMFSMSFHMNKTILKVKTTISDQNTLSSSDLFLSVREKGGINPSHFDTFAILMLITNSIVSSLVISMIRYGNHQQGIKNIPLFLIVSVLLYFAGKNLLGFIVVSL